MNLALNLVLLATGVGGFLAAFGGHTWRSSPKPGEATITRRGWAALLLTLLAAGVGVAKEVRSERARRAGAADLVGERENAAQSLATQTARAEHLQQKVDSLLNRTPTSYGSACDIQPGQTLAITRGGRAVSVSAGDQFAYFLLPHGGRPREDEPTGLVLKAGDKTYPLAFWRHEVQFPIWGRTGTPIPLEIENTGSSAWGLKWHVETLGEVAEDTAEPIPEFNK